MRHLLPGLFAMLLLACTQGASHHPETAKEHVIDSSRIYQGSLIAEDTAYIATGWYYANISAIGGVQKKKDRSAEMYSIDTVPILTAKNFKKVTVYRSEEDGYTDVGLKFEFDKEGTERFANTIVGNEIALVINNRLLSVAKNSGGITSGVVYVYLDYPEAELFRLRRAAMERQ